MAERERSSYETEPYDIYSHRGRELVRMSKAKHWDLNEGEPDIRGWTVRDRDGDNIGEVDDLLIDPDARVIPFADINYDQFMGMGGKHRLVPLEMLDLDTDNEIITFHGVKDDLDQSPDYTREETDFGPYYDYWYSRRPTTGAFEEPHAEAPERPAVTGAERVVPEVEEHLEAVKKVEPAGEVELHKEVETKTETVRAPVRRTVIRVFRRDVEPGREPKPGEQTLREGETISIPLTEEHVEAQKRAEVTGEVVVQPETIEEEEEVSGEVRKERVVAEKHGGAEFDEDVDVDEDKPAP